MNSFRTYELALELYRDIEICMKESGIKGVKRDQLERSALSVPLNLTEGRSRPTLKQLKHFYFIALGSLREVQALIVICNLPLVEKADKVGAHLYKLCHS